MTIKSTMIIQTEDDKSIEISTKTGHEPRTKEQVFILIEYLSKCKPIILPETPYVLGDLLAPGMFDEMPERQYTKWVFEALEKFGIEILDE